MRIASCVAYLSKIVWSHRLPVIAFAATVLAVPAYSHGETLKAIILPFWQDTVPARENFSQFTGSIVSMPDGGLLAAIDEWPVPEAPVDVIRDKKSNSIVLVRVDANGNELWRNRYQSFDHGGYYSAVVAQHGGSIYLCDGVANLYRLTLDGEVVWHRHWVSRGELACRAMIVSDDGAVYVAGTQLSGPFDQLQPSLNRIDATTGKTIWTITHTLFRVHTQSPIMSIVQIGSHELLWSFTGHPGNRYSWVLGLGTNLRVSVSGRILEAGPPWPRPYPRRLVDWMSTRIGCAAPGSIVRYDQESVPEDSDTLRIDRWSPGRSELATTIVKIDLNIGSLENIVDLRYVGQLDDQMIFAVALSSHSDQKLWLLTVNASGTVLTSSHTDIDIIDIPMQERLGSLVQDDGRLFVYSYSLDDNARGGSGAAVFEIFLHPAPTLPRCR